MRFPPLETHISILIPRSSPLLLKLSPVTGGSRGIGAAIAIKLAEHGAHLAINYVSSATAAEAVAEQVRSHGVTAITVKADVSQEEEVSAMFKTIMEKFGRLDIAVSNSGIEYFAEHSETTGADIDRVFGVNVKGQYFVAQQAYKYMADHGRVMLTSSISAVKVGTFDAIFMFWANFGRYPGCSSSCCLCCFEGRCSGYDQVSCC